MYVTAFGKSVRNVEDVGNHLLGSACLSRRFAFLAPRGLVVNK